MSVHTLKMSTSNAVQSKIGLVFIVYAFNGYMQILSGDPYSLLKVSMIRKYQNHTLQTNPRHGEEEPQNIYSTNTSVRQ